MKVKRVVANIRTGEPDAADAFYRAVLGLEAVMDHGWIAHLRGCIAHDHAGELRR